MPRARLAPVDWNFEPADAVITRRCYEEIGNHQANATNAMFLALHESRSGDSVAASRWAKRSLQLAIDHGQSYLAQWIDPAIAIIKRHSPNESAVLFGALRAHRDREWQAGTQAEIDAEARYATSLRRALGDRFDAL